MEYEVEGPRPRERPKRTWREVVKEDCQAHKLNTEDAMDRRKWRKLIKDVDNQDGCEWASFFRYRPTWVVPDQWPLNSCVCVCVLIYSQATVITREQMILTMTYNVHLHRMIKLNSSQLSTSSVTPASASAWLRGSGYWYHGIGHIVLFVPLLYHCS